MSNIKYKIMKVFDCQDMPKNIQKIFFEYFEKGNDIYIRFDLYDIEEYSEDLNCLQIYNWLKTNGAEDNESVIIKHWW